MRAVKSLIAFLLLSIPGFLFAQKSPFQVLYPTTTILLQPGSTQSLNVTIAIPPQYFVYQEKTKLKFLDLKGFEVEKIEYPSAKTRQDPFFKKRLEVFEGEAVIHVVLRAPEGVFGPKTLEALLTLQGCSDVLCYPEETHLISLNLDVAPAGSVAMEAAKPQVSLKELLATQDFSLVLGQNAWLVLLVVFLGGFLTSLTPCVLPVIPITLMIIGVRSESPLRRNFLLSLVLVLGLALTYAFLGVSAVAFGKSLGFVFQQQWFVLLLAVLFFFLALSMLGFFEIHLPQRLSQKLNQIKGHGLCGAFVSGGAAGILAAPCAGPVIGALLLYVATTQSYFQGFGLLFIYAVGMGVLFVALGTGYGTLQARFRGVRFTIWVKRLLGLLLLLGSLFYLNTVFPFQKTLERFLAKPAPIHWFDSETEGLAIAKREDKVMLIDFYADWCAPCKELELGFFRKSEVVALLKQMVPVRIDATFTNEEVSRVLAKYRVVGWPTIKFVAPDGKILEELTVVSYNPKVLLRNMRLALGQ